MINKVSSEQLKERTGCSRASEGMDRQSQLKRQLDRQADEKCVKIQTTGTLRKGFNRSLFYSTCTLLAWELGPLHCLLLMFQADIPQFPSLNSVLLEIKLGQP